MLRLTESFLQTQQRLQHQRIIQANIRVSEEPVQTQQRLQQKRIRQEYLRVSEESIQIQQQQRIRKEILRTSDYREQRLRVGRPQQIKNETLILLEDKCLSICGEKLLQLGLPVPTIQAHHTLDRDLLREANHDITISQHMVEGNKPRLTEDQRTDYETVMNLIAEGNGGILFLEPLVELERHF
ncbi:hypothetical protein AVEN_108981-1 [Araneus ventricosus]|uniref:Uncharacterized protein n=1 Tax=Araneus ventricosus TaxID=182803 RepID=A0A4Y2F3V3_ARAVE|nr:hypothetical protein AVEN_108981-1 [Araneus ventricosus]